MNKIINMLIVGILLISCAAAIGIGRESDVSTTSVQVTFTKPIMKQTTIDDQIFVEMSVDRPFGTLHKPGEPLLPRKVETFEFPFGTKITDVSYEFKNLQSFSLSQKILPAPYPVISGMQAEPVFTMKEEIYQLDEFYPDDWFKISTGGGLNGDNEQKTFVTVQTFPARYNPVDNTVLYVDGITVSIQYEEPKEPLLSANDEFDMVIIAPECFSSDLQPLIDHKNSVDVKTFLKTTEEIYDEYDGVDRPEQIKYFIKDAKETWNVTYVLLVGGLKSIIYGKPRDDPNQGSKDWHLPVRYTNLVEQGSFNDPGFISDLYFMDIYDGEVQFSSWDSNGAVSYTHLRAHET